MDYVINENVFVANDVGLVNNTLNADCMYEDNIYAASEIESYSFSASGSDVCVSYTVPQAEYMYGCTATVVGMLIGYYDRWGYMGYNMSNLIAGQVELNARGTDGNMYDMDAFDTVLGKAIASREYVERFYNKTPAEELPYTFVDGTNELNISEWNCLADYLGTGQYWRKNGDLATRMYFTSLASIKNTSQTTKINSGGTSVTIPIKYIDFIYGLSLYVEDKGYKLDDENCMSVDVDINGGSFTFEDYCAEIDAGRLVIIHITGHSMLGYGYNKSTKEIIFDDTYRHDQRMKWNGRYTYSGASCALESVSIIHFDISDEPDIPDEPDEPDEPDIPDVPHDIAAPVYKLSTSDWTNSNVTVTASFDKNAVLNQYSFDGKNWQTYTKAVIVDENKTVYFRSQGSNGNTSTVTQCQIKNIDKVKPLLNISGNVSQWTDKDVVLTVNSSDALSGIASVKYSYDNETWYDYRNEIVVSENKIIYFRVVDNAGNVSVKTEVVDKINKNGTSSLSAPTYTLSPAAWTNFNVTLTAAFDKNAVYNEYSFDGRNWYEYTERLVISENKTVYLRSTANNVSKITECTVNNIDKVKPLLNISGNVSQWTDKDVVLTVSSSDSLSGVASVKYSYDNAVWHDYKYAIVVSENKTVYFRATDNAGNVTSAVEVVDKIAKDIPTKPQIKADTDAPTNQFVTLYAVYGSGVVRIEYSFDGKDWHLYDSALKVEENGKVYFRSYNVVGYVSEIAEYEVANIDRTPPVIELDADTETLLEETVLAAKTDEVSTLYYSLDNSNWTLYTGELTVRNNRTYYFKAVDAADNVSYKSVTFNNMIKSAPRNLHGTDNGISWESGAECFEFQLSKNDFKNILQLEIYGNGIDFYSMPSGNYDCRIKISAGSEWSETAEIKSQTNNNISENFKADENGRTDVFFSSSYKNWTSAYSVCHVGIKGVWEGTEEKIKINEKIRIQDTYEGSADREILVLTDYAVGDVICLDDVFTGAASGGITPRISLIEEIIAGAGADIVDLTSQRFEYETNVIVRGGSGDDVIWANCGENKLFGDSGNDRIVGGNNNDIIVGGSGNDSMHGGGGDDVFCFGGNFGNDSVEQLAGGKIILHFAEENGIWDAEKRIYTAGENSVAVLGSADVELRFGMDEELASIGAFEDFTSEKIFEEQDKILLA